MRDGHADPVELWQALPVGNPMVGIVMFLRTIRTVCAIRIIVMIGVKLMNETTALKHGVRRYYRPKGQQNGCHQ